MKGVLRLDHDNEGCWIDLDLGEGRERYALCVTRSDEGVVLDLYGCHPDGDYIDGTLGSTYAFDSDVRDARDEVERLSVDYKKEES